MNIATDTVQISDKDKRTTLIALLIVFLLAALDMSILSTAMPRIVSELNGLELYAWVTTAYMLASTVLVPIYGKLGDLYGRKLILVIGVSIFLLGSALCGISGEFGTLPLLGDGMHQLVIFRAVKGIGGAALFTSAMGIIADLYPPLQRAKFMGLFGAIFGISSIIGPAIGGFLTDFATVTIFGHEIAGWRWVFYANIPLGLVALFMIAFKTPRLNHGSRGPIDFAGAFLLLVVFIPFLLALTWGGSKYEWNSPLLMGMFALSAVSLLLFIWVESRAKEAIMPLSMFQNRVFVITNATSFVISMAFLGVVMFMPLFMQVVLGVNATNSGFSMFPLMLGLMTSSILSGRLVSRSGNYKLYMSGGAAVLIVGVFLLGSIGPETTLMDLSWRMVVVGLGLGPSQSLVNLIVQAAVLAKATAFVGTYGGVAQLALRMVGSLGRIDQSGLRTGKLKDQDWEKLAEAVDRLKSASIFIDETPALNSAELRARARRMARQFGGTLGLIVIDYLQLMSGSSSSDENRATVLGEISRGLKGLAKELQCPVIALSQLNRSVETRTDKRPMMSDLRESGAIEQDADVIMFIYRDEYYTKEACKEPGVAEVIIAKQRNGPTGVVKLAFLKPITKFESLANGGGGDY